MSFSAGNPLYQGYKYGDLSPGFKHGAKRWSEAFEHVDGDGGGCLACIDSEPVLIVQLGDLFVFRKSRSLYNFYIGAVE